MDLTFLIIGVIYFLRILSWLIIARVIISWVAPHSHHPAVLFIVQTTDPIIKPIRRMLPRGRGGLAMIDWSPLVALIVVDLIRSGVIRLFS